MFEGTSLREVLGQIVKKIVKNTHRKPRNSKFLRLNPLQLELKGSNLSFGANNQSEYFKRGERS